ncbi:nucleotidyltransferase domain-containing protein [Demequina sp. SYSU T00192]|uniref:Nucleotidyltransferase domain-containing protein n=1 Tax=Demequina litoralis TaxID=3051660 RepID=A0ABT8G9L2_9MICO|nr:nucleotidyltransferase domain-containing protein [Demequina sp. SYSU T00192]MDN4475817.1 nucleotidyltransferase domain-containing protein [Demequina sp. SYSU T00192]
MSECLRDVAVRCDAMVEKARRELVAAVRNAYASGETQAAIATQIGRSQPEVNRLLRFHGTTPHARKLRAHSAQVREELTAVGGRNVRVFGSTAAGTDGPGSDVDLVFEMREPLSLMQLSAVERRLSALLGVEVDLVPESSLREDLRDRILAEAITL